MGRDLGEVGRKALGLAVSNGVKILVVYLLISVGTNLGNVWVAEAQGASTSASPEMVAFDVMAAALMYMMLCWQIPKLFSAVLGGSPALSGGDFIAAGTSLIAGGAAIAGVAAGGAAVLAGGARAIGGVGGAAGAGTGSALSVSSAGDIGSTGMGGGSVPPPAPTGSDRVQGSAAPGNRNRRVVPGRRERTSPRRRAKHRRQTGRLAKLPAQRESSGHPRFGVSANAESRTALELCSAAGPCAAWRFIAILSAMATLMAVVGIVVLSARSKMVPFVVAIDSLGRTVSVGSAEVTTTTDEKLKKAVLFTWIEDLRLVTTDPFARRKAIDHVYAHLAMGSEAQAFVTAFYRGDPAQKRGQTQTVSIDVKSVLPNSNRTYEN